MGQAGAFVIGSAMLKAEFLHPAASLPECR